MQQTNKKKKECVHSLHISDIMGGRPGQKATGPAKPMLRCTIIDR